MTRTTAKAFQERFTELGLAGTQLAVDSTITERTFALSGATLPLQGDGALPSLPQISFDTAATMDASAGPSASTHNPDLRPLRTLGEGGMGRVHLARQHSLQREVAVKTLKAGASPQVAEALKQEARVTGALDHPGVIPVHALGLDQRGTPLLVMKRVDGVEWRELVYAQDHELWARRPGDDPIARHVEILVQICQTVEFAHSRGVLHLDIKPENVMVGGFGEVYLVDWGIARRMDQPASHGGIVGTPAYMAPEMVLGSALDPRTDVYLLGATLHEVLVRGYRHSGANLETVLLSAALSEPYEYGPEVPEALADLCNRATAQDPEERPVSAGAFRRELAEFLSGRSAQALAEAALARLEKLETALHQVEADAPPVDLHAAYQLGTEARFGLSQALAEHADLPVARRGYERCLRALIDLELRQDHVDSAAALLAEMPTPDVDLEKKLGALRARLLAQGQEEQRLRAMAQDLDPTVSARARTFALIAIGALLVLVSVFVSLTFGMGGITREAMFGIIVTVTSVIGFVLFLARHHILTNSFNKRLAALMMLMLVGSCINRTASLVSEASPSAVFTTDLGIYLGVMVGATVGIVRQLWVGAAVFAIALAASRVRPDLAGGLYSGSSILAVAIVAAVLLRESARAKLARAPSPTLDSSSEGRGERRAGGV